MAAIQHLPFLGTAEPDVLFASWLLAPGASVRRGQPIAAVETLKAAFEVEAEHDGELLAQLAAVGDRVAMQAPIAVIGRAGETYDLQGLLAAAAPVHADAAPTPAPTTTPAVAVDSGVGRPIAPAARRRASELGLAPEQVPGTGPGGLVRVQDVEAAHAARTAPCQAAAAPAAPAAGDDGRLDPQFLALLARDAAAFGALSSELKVDLYRRAGARIADGCRIGAGTVLQFERLVLGPDAHFGPGGTFAGRELVAGALLHFGARCRVRCTRLQFGDNAFLTDDLEIGGGGATDPEALLAIGSHGFVGEHVHLNPCRPIRIGDEVVVSRQAVLMTHSFGNSWLRGYPSRFAGLTIGDGAQIGIGAVLFPGIEVGAGAVVLSASSVVSSVPPGRLFGGVPATDLKAAAQVLTPAEVAARAAELLAEFARQLALRGHAASLVADGDGRRLLLAMPDGPHVLRWHPAGSFGAADAGWHEDVRVAVAFAGGAWAAIPTAATAIELEPPRIRGADGPLAAAFREFLRKRGVRLEPRAWAYRGGLL